MSDTEIIDAPLPDEIVADPPEKATEEKPEDTAEETTEETSEEPEETSEESEEDGDDEADEEKPKPKRRRNLQKRIGQLTQQRAQAQQEAEELRQQLQALQAQAEPAAEPKQEDFQSYDDFVAAKSEFAARETVRKELETLGQNVQQSQTKAEHAARAADWDLKVEDARDKYDDFDEVAQNPDLPVTQAMAQAIQESENGADVAYHLGSHPKLSREIASLSPVQAVIRIGQISQKLQEPARPKTTAASPPIKTVKTSGAKVSKNPEDMDMNEYVEWRRKGGK